VWTALAALACLAALPTAARAQSAIAGVVKDTSGAVLPGVTVEAASDVLIEKTRSVTTDGQGAYRIVDLRPGVYELSFTLPGFQTTKREGLELPANFTATINADLKVGSLEESVTVAGSSPVVDVQTNSKSQVLSRDVLDAVPTARTIQGIGQLVVGVNLSSPDVGGSRAMQQAYFAVHGTSREQTIVTVDGLITNGIMFDGGVQAYHNEAMIQEAVYQTAGGAGETPTGGLNMNLVPKDGGNRFTGGAKITKSPKQWQGDNLTDFLRSRGVGSVDRIENFWEANIEEGGPIIQNTLWFFGAFRHARYDKPIANTFYVPAGMKFPAGYAACIAGTLSCEQGVSDEKMDNPIARLTWQVSPRNKFSVFNDRAMRFRGHAMGAGTDPETASVVWNTPTFATGSAKWTSTISARLMVEGGFSFNRERYDNLYQPGILQPYGSDAWYANARHNDTGASVNWIAANSQHGNYPDRYNYTLSSSYITGTHNVKVGIQHSWGPYRQYDNANADLYQNYTNGRPTTITALSTPTAYQDDMTRNIGLYAQDSWKLNKLTVNLGLRFESVLETTHGQPAQNGRFVRAPAYDDIPLPTWNDWSPRASVVYDLFGTGKTAVRFGYNKFMTAATTGVAQIYDPSGPSSQSLTWIDANGDDIAQGQLGCTFQTPGCEINLAQLPDTFGLVSATTFDPDLQRPYQLSANLGISHELFPGISVTAEWFHTDFKNLTVRNNVLRTASDYTPVDVVSPLDGRVITVYNVRPEKLSAVSYVDSTEPDLKQWYNGVEFNFNARLPKGARLFGGTATERTLANSCAAATTNPNVLLYCDQTRSGIPWSTQFKLAGTYPLPWYGITVSGSYQGLPGYRLGTQALSGGFQASDGGLNTPSGQGTYWQLTTNTNYAADCLGPCRPGQRVIPGQTANLNVPLVAPGSERTPRNNQFDFSASKSFTVSGVRINPKIDIFNALNSDDYQGVRTLLYGGTAYYSPSTILQGRIVRVGVDLKW
jgi:hypothetical protein